MTADTTKYILVKKQQIVHAIFCLVDKNWSAVWCHIKRFWPNISPFLVTVDGHGSKFDFDQSEGSIYFLNQFFEEQSPMEPG